jgi:hypothetical protein
MEIFSTIVTGVTVFILGELILRLFIEPIQEMKKLQRQLIEDMSFYANIYTNATIDSPEFRIKIYEVSDLLRRNAVKIESIIHIIPLYDLCVKANLVPHKNEIYTIKGKLICISNLITGEQGLASSSVINEWAIEVEAILKNSSKEQNYKNFDFFSSFIIFILFMLGTVTLVNYLSKATQYIIGVF